MKRYVTTSIDNDTFRNIKASIEDYVEDYYGLMGYEEDECPKPVCKIEKDGTSNGKSIYEISIDFYTLDEYDVEDICNEFDNLADYPKFPLYKNFSWDGEYTFTGYVIER